MDKFQEIHIEKDFWDDFIVEAFEHIDAIESNAMDLEKNPENMDIIHTMFRAFHTIKGLSGFVEHTIIQEVAHKTETMMDLCRKGELKVSTKIVDAILKSSDYVKQLCNDMDAYQDHELLDNIENLLTVLEEVSNTDLFPKTQETPSQQAEVVQPVESEPANDFNLSQECENNSVESQEDGLDFFAKEISDFEVSEEKNEEATANEQVQCECENGTDTNNVEENIDLESHEQFEQQENQEVNDWQNNNEHNENCDFQECQAQESSDIQPESQEQIENLVQSEVLVEPQETIEFEALNQETIEEAKTNTEPEKPLTVEDLALKSFQNTVIEKLKGNNVSKEDSSKDGSSAKQPSANEEYMKVANHKIDHLVEMMGELIINQALIEQYVSLNYNEDRQLVANMSGFLRITRELQNLSMSLRMVALKPTFQKLTRIARDTIQELKKDVEFVMSGETTEIDRAVAEKLLDPLVHMIKNAISHGIEEDSADRVRIGKAPKARVELNAYSKRGKIFIEVKDDGKGINTEIVYNKAIEKGIIDPTRTYSDAEIKEFIMLPGFSTAKVVDNISGRGVGMDVVKTQILKLGGKVEIQSTLNEGSTFTLEVPVNHAIMNGTIVEMNEQHFVVPTVNVKEFLQPTDSQWIFTKSKRTMIKVRDNIIPIVPLSTFFKGIKEPDKVPLVMVLELEQELRAVPIVNVINRQEVVVKPVGTEFSHLKYISGMSILGTGKVSLILDIDYLFRKEVKE